MLRDELPWSPTVFRSSSDSTVCTGKRGKAYGQPLFGNHGFQRNAPGLLRFIRIPAGGQFRLLAIRGEPSTNFGKPKKKALPVAEPFSFPYGWNQYFRVSPFCSEKYVARSCMSLSDRACACPPMMGFLRTPLLY